MAVLVGGQGTNSFATMHYDTFSKKLVSASSYVTRERKLPTEFAIKLHFYREYYQTAGLDVDTVFNVVKLFVSTSLFGSSTIASTAGTSYVIPDTIIR